MTQLTKPVRRELGVFLDVDRGSRGRPIIVELEPPGVIVFRWKGTRRRYEAGAAMLMQWTIQRAIDQARIERAKRKRGKP